MDWVVSYTLLRDLNSCKACADSGLGSQRSRPAARQENNSAKRCGDDRTQPAEASAIAASSSPLRPRRRCPYAARQGGSARACGAPTHSRTIPAAHEIVVWKVRNCARHLLAREVPLGAPRRARPQPCLAKCYHGKADRTHLIPTLHASRSITRTIAPPAGVTTRAASSGTS